MNFKENIPKYKPKLFSWLLILAITLTTFLQYPITAYAAPTGESIVASVIVDVTGQDGGQGSATIQNGVKYNRTGFLCYLLKEDGGLIPNMTAYAFECDNSAYIGGSAWFAEARVGGYTASRWKGVAPWKLPPFNEDVSTNQAAIKAWMKELDGDAANGVQFVKDNWGLEIAQKFGTGEYVLVIETLMNFQYSEKNNGSSQQVSISRDAVKLSVEKQLAPYPDTVILEMCKAYASDGVDDEESLISLLTEKAWRKIQDMDFSGGTYTKIGVPIIGTPSNILKYKEALKTNSTLFDKYTNKNAPFAEYILPGGPGERAGFVPWTGSTSSKLTNDQVHTYGVAMMVIKAMDDAIHTYWQPNGSPGDPEPSLPNKTGKCNIVKCYYNENLTTHVKTDLGTFTRKDCTNKIIISGEPGFELVEWRVTNQTDLSFLFFNIHHKVLFFCSFLSL